MRRPLAAVVSAVLLASLLVVPSRPVVAAPPSGGLSAQVEPFDADGGEVRGTAWQQQQPPTAKPPEPVWPSGSARVTLTDPSGPADARASASNGQRVQAGNLPVWLARGAKPGDLGELTAEVIDRKRVPAGWHTGLLLRLNSPSPARGEVNVRVDYGALRHAFGADWSSRLRLWSLPACAMETPDLARCAPTALRSVNDTAATAVSADVLIASTALVALAAAGSGPSGDFTATPMSPTSSWAAGGATGGFSWSYPLRVPPALNGPVPSIGLSYSSASVDGRSAATNNQPSWIGEGFDYSPGFIERRYVTCLDDEGGAANNSTDKGDLCWRSDNATMSLNGTSSELIFQSGKGWHARSEQGSKIEKLTGTANGDNDGEHWKVTTPDGVQYFFGRNALPGQTGRTESAWTAPVFGNHPDDPCHKANFADSSCTQAWRWNLDYVIDPRGNTMSYWYDKEFNQYAANVTDSANRKYVRGGSLRRIDYGTWDRGTADRSVSPTARVAFDLADRCLSNCGTHGSNWPDVPWDEECALDATSCDNKFSPTFWTTKRLSKVTTKVWDTTKPTPAWQDVDSWELTHSFPNPGDGTNAGLWLASIKHTGHVGQAITLPPVTFEPTTLPNRVLSKTNTSNNWHRIGNIITESGAKIQVTYSLPECTTSAAPESNTKLCYPVLGRDPADQDKTLTEWWYKYVVRQVSESDVQLTNGHQAPTQNTYYEYVGAPAWHYADDDGLSKPKYKTWNQFRGYAQVLTRKGDIAGRQTLTDTRYLRGMHGDRLNPSGGTRPVTVGASIGSETVYDEDAFAGMIREQTVYNGVTSKPVSRTVSVPWQSPATASRTINGDVATARFVAERIKYSATALGVDGARGWRTTRTVSSLDGTYGAVNWTQDDGDIAVSGDETCATSTYNRNTGKNIVDLVMRTTTTALPCGQAPTKPDDVIADVRNYYDSATSADTPPTYGAITRVEQLKDWTPAGGTVFQTISQVTVDAFGRPLSTTDVRGNITTIQYTPASGGPVTRVTSTVGPYSWKTVEEKSPYWGVTIKSTDPNGRVTEASNDALGRVVQVWSPSWTRAAHPTMPVERYTYWYSTGRSDYSYVKSEKLHAGGGYRASFEIYDGHLRLRQTQVPAIGGGRVVTDTIYDAWGRISASYGAHGEPGEASGTLWWEPEWSLRAVGRIEYDNAGRQVSDVFLAGDGVSNLVEQWHTTNGHEGDLIKMTPPPGGTPTTTVKDVKDRTTHLRQHTTAAGVDGAYLTTRFEYDRKNQLTKLVDPGGNEWRYTYDLRGRQVQTRDPDKGLLVSRYNDHGDLIETTDAAGRVVSYTYDDIGRSTALYDGTGSAAKKRKEFKYDRLPNQEPIYGQLTEAIRYEPPGSANAYAWQARSFNARNQVTSSQYVIPAVETGLNGTYVYANGFSDRDGSPTTAGYPAVADLPGETVTTEYDAVSGLPTALSTNRTDTGSYVVSQQYTGYGEPSLTKRKIAGGVYVDDSTDYDIVTRRVSRTSVKPETASGTISERSYRYDPAGNITAISDVPQVGPADNQCFQHDRLRQLTAAWTPKAGVDCATAPNLSNLGGPAPYWHDWTFDTTGNRRTETVHATAGNTVRTYTVPASGTDSVRPHTVTSTLTETPGVPPATASYGYDATGNMIARAGPSGGDQGLTWDAEGHLATVTEGTATTTNLYDANGTRLIRRDAGGTTLYLPGMEIRQAKGVAAATATRYYSFTGRQIASRVAGTNGLTWLFTDHQGTQQVSVNAYTQAVSIRRQTPYGSSRGAQPLWPNPKGFVGGDLDPTGLTHIGAREYDPALGRFISVDPLMDSSDPQQWNGYSYANNSPITFSDPTGLILDEIAAKRITQDEIDRIRNTGSSESPEQARRIRKADPDLANVRKPPPKFQYWVGHYFCITQSRCHVSDLSPVEIKIGLGKYLCKFYELCDGQPKSNEEQWKDIAEVLSWIPGIGIPASAYLAQQALDRGDYLGAALEIIGMVPAAKGAKYIDEAADGAADVADGAADVCKVGHSFDPDTLVLLADGSVKRIEDVELGDEVVATDPDSDRTESKPVTELHVNRDEDLTTLTVETANGERVELETTWTHPFWSRTDGDWVEAEDLNPGDLLRTLGRGEVRVVEVRNVTGAETMYDLTVADIHTYYVLAGDTPVLVHNTCGLRTLGHYPDYVDLAKTTGAKHFSVPDDVWNRMSPAEQWAANRKFLDRGITNGDTFLLATPVDVMRTNSWYAEELNYLMSKGYTFNSTGTAMIPGR
ncbi:polymorphic toxin-type HINT domain-containing protein [Micromonospora parva]|uniref:polymorphic toxin-type HINT domain-containing protein n=1 Tax=Micromonospora parva TaxID=1464048 RepID=UPI0037BE0F49